MFGTPAARSTIRTPTGAGYGSGATAHSQTLANGNQIAGLGSFVRTDGSTGMMGDVALVEDTFARAFTDHVALAEGVAALPDMQGAGRVRDLREAASLSPELKTVLAQYSQAATRQEQRAIHELGRWCMSAWMRPSRPRGSVSATTVINAGATNQHRRRGLRSTRCGFNLIRKV